MTENNASPAAEICCTHPDELTTTIVSAYVSNNPVPKGELPELITSVRAAISGGSATLITAPPAAQPPVRTLTPAEVKKSVTPDAIISFIDGKSYKTLKRHLTKHGLTPESYRAKFGLPFDYPLVAPNYAAARSEIAKALQLGVPKDKREA